MMLKDLFLDYLVNYEASIRNVPTIASEDIEIPTNKYSRMLEYAENKKQNEESPVVENKNLTIKWIYSTPLEGITTAVSTSWSSPYSDRNKWMADMTAAYKKAGLNDNAIKNLIAKNSLESNWGTSTLSRYNNFGGITAGRSWKGDIIESGDKDKNGNPIKLKFRSYKSLDDYVKDEILFLTNLYDFNLDDDINTFLSKLQGNNKGKRSYAEDPSYKNKIKQRYLNI